MAGERILVADDESDVLDVCERILRADGYEVVGVLSGQQAIEAVREAPFDVFLTDIMMPGLSGLETAQEILKINADIVCVVMTGFGTMDTAIQALKLGFDEFLVKPFTPEDLISAVARALEKKRLRLENARLQALIPLFEINKTLMSTVDTEVLLQRVVQIAREETEADDAILILMEKRGLEIRARDSGISEESTPDPLLVDLADRVIQSQEQHLIPADDPESPWAPFIARAGLGIVLATPLILQGRAIGALILTKRDVTQGFSPSEAELISVLAGQAAVAIDNARLFSEIQRAYDDLRRLDHMKSEFINIAAHELRTPLAILLGHANLLQEEIEDEAIQERLAIIVRNAMRLRNLINDMLNLRHLETGEARVRLQEIDLRELIEETLRDFIPLAQEKAHRVHVDIPDDLPLCLADREKTTIALSNLLSNAIKFTPDGGAIGVRVKVNSREFQISVWDTGIGIPAEEQERIFRRFYQVEDSLTREHEGIGLGLAITKGLIELWGGRIWVDSEPGKGSTFTFTIPFPKDTLPPLA